MKTRATIAKLDLGDTDPSYPESELRANAALIAAAPEMLEALEACIKAGMIGSEVAKAQDLARKAIAKARGES